MYKLLRLVRIQTIVFAALILYAMRYGVIRPMLEVNGFSLQMSDGDFLGLVLAICCLISGAYVINDYFDTKSDRISGVKEIVVGKSISRREAIFLHSLFNIIAVAIAFYLGFSVGIWEIGLLFLLVSGLLWFYSSTGKKHFWTGNLLASILASLIPISAVIYEIPLLNRAYGELLAEKGIYLLFLFDWVFGFSWFIFLNTLIYEINKDIYTVEGDRENGIQSIPVKWGIKTAEHTIVSLVCLAIISLFCAYFLEFSASWVIGAYMLVALLLPYGIYLFSILKKRGQRRFQLCWIRIILVMCIGMSVLLKHFFHLIYTH